jgi:hypothetical protein
MQVEPQNPSQTKPPREYHFKPGRSGNPSGKTRTQLRTAEFMDLFREVRGRAPNVVEATTIRNAGALAAKVEQAKTSAEDVVRCGRLLAQLLAQLGLDAKPSPPAPKSPLETLREHLDHTHGGAT